MLVDRLERDDVPVWLVNTGWTGGPYGTGERMNIAHTRSIVRAALDGSLARIPTRTDPIFGVEVPTACPDVPAHFLDPRGTWPDPVAYDRRAGQLAGMFADNFEAYSDGVSESIRAAGHGEAVVGAHGGLLVAAIKALARVPAGLSLDNCSITRLELPEHDARLVSANEIAHLEGIGLGTKGEL